MENPIKMDDLGGKPTIFWNIHIHKNICPAVFIFIEPLRSHEFISHQDDWMAMSDVVNLCQKTIQNLRVDTFVYFCPKLKDVT